MRYFCCDERRREVVKLNGVLNGLDYVEVDDSGIAGDPIRQRTLFLKFLQPPPVLAVTNIVIDGGERIESVAVDWLAPATALPAGEPPELVEELDPPGHFLVIRTRFYGDFSFYTLRLVSAPGDDTPPAGFDPRLTSLQFSFKVQCEADFDCAEQTACASSPSSAPLLDYMARDYRSFRRLMLDRMRVLLPEWQSRSSADLGVALVELLAYTGDHLSYQQDAVATEAYLGTARRRTSLKRHARLMDYKVHEGCNARCLVRVFVNDDAVMLPRATAMLTRTANIANRIAPGGDDWLDALAAGAEVFETVEDSLLYQPHEEMELYSWGERECCLSKGATAATLRGRYPHLKAGDVVILAEQFGPRTGFSEDADRSHRHGVRLTHVQPSEDPSGGLFLEPPDTHPVPVTEIQWEEADALPFTLCISTITDKVHGEQYLDRVSVVYGNVVLADHGRSIKSEPLGVVPRGTLAGAALNTTLNCDRLSPAYIPPRFRPLLAEGPLAHALPLQRSHYFAMETTPAILADLEGLNYSADVQAALQGQGIHFSGTVLIQGGDGCWSVADGRSSYRLVFELGRLQVYSNGLAVTRLLAEDPRRARPQVTLSSYYIDQTDTWHPRQDLLASNGEAREFVVETEHDRTSFIRFGDDYHGRRPESDTEFSADYRIGNGISGNVGLESIAHIVTHDGRLLRVSNPMPARGGVDPESAEQIRRDVPEAFRTQERAVTPADYAEIAAHPSDVQKAAATFRWTGSWHTVFITADRKGGKAVDDQFEDEILDHVERYRMAGYDLEVDGPRYVPLELAMTVCVKPEYFRSDVRAALMRIFSKGWLEDGRPALFHPDNFTFGQPVYLSRLYAAAQSVQGVASVVIDRFQRLRMVDDRQPLDDGVLKLGRLEIARLDNDPNFPERGVVHIEVGGGK
ncbi:putative baseplate assembly protein [Desulfopila aestuarii]|uniref:Putative baseplate assembly protein n=1 Tax=Desulfopila aestuarii DSM 18488 TaxID=1121416 RepID=A0A1M7XYN8_9BACT|nr:putative baseplate assembly protein [Desulfopila aestuarii]SHO44157.1 putative baseplate assembly protein [Desulfopila aestuarii DSM 18488]